MKSPKLAATIMGSPMIISIFSGLIVAASMPASSMAGTERCHPVDKKALLQFKAAYNNYSNIFPSWDPASDCCRYWYGVKCDLTTHHRVNRLIIVKGDLPGPIPAALGNLPYLETLIIRHVTNVTGTIPSSITKLKHLIYLDLSWLNLTGTIPHFLTRLNNLTSLDLSFNRFTGPIPSSLSEIPGLNYIGLDRNQLTGTIPASLENLKANYIYLRLSHNMLSGPIPASFGEIDFEDIDLSRNQLEGDISMLFGPNKTVENMDLSRNMFEFNMSNLEVHSRLRYLDVNHNKIYGSLPKEMINNVQFLNVSYNRLCGEIPQGGSLQTLDYSSYFHNRCLCGAPLNVTCH